LLTFQVSISGICLKIVPFNTSGLLWYISLDFLAQKVYFFLEVGKFALKETTGAIWMKEEDLPR